jgi:hypothetical protein
MLSAFLKLKPSSWVRLPCRLVLVVAMRIGLLFVSAAFLTRTLVGDVKHRSAPPSVQQVRDLAWTIAIVSRIVPQATCLTQVLAFQYFLNRLGLESQQCIGVDGSDAHMEVHAWVETIYGRVLFDPGNRSRYVRLPGSTTRK